MSALTMTDVELLVIKKRDLENLLNHYPRIKEEMSAIAHQRAEKNEGAQKVARQADFKIEPQQYNIYIYIYKLGFRWFAVHQADIIYTILSLKR